MVVTVATEGLLDTAVVRRILRDLDLELGPVHGEKGKSSLDRNLRGYNNAARFAPWLVLRDLDRDAECPPELLPSLLASPAAMMRFRIAVRSVEAWLLADAKGIQRFLRIPEGSIPVNPETLTDAKQTIVNLARRSRSREIREDLIPSSGTTSRVGPAYTARLVEFAARGWRPRIAARGSSSLRRCIDSLEAWAERES
jgi:hypothetical protein